MHRTVPPSRETSGQTPPLKSHDSIVAVLFTGRLARVLIPYAERAEVTPNQITMASLAITLLATPFIALGQRKAWILAAVLVQVGFVLDCLDGQLARATGRTTDFGRYLDSLTDLVKIFSLISAMTVALLHHGGGTPACALGALAFFGYVLCDYHTQLARQLPQRSQEDYEERVTPWKSRLVIGGQRIDLAFAFGEVLMTISVALCLGRIREGLVALLVITPIQFGSYAIRFWGHRYLP